MEIEEMQQTVHDNDNDDDDGDEDIDLNNNTNTHNTNTNDTNEKNNVERAWTKQTKLEKEQRLHRKDTQKFNKQIMI